jgi:flagellum-specific peptidoglycan hydrolase FlgJ
MALRRLTGAQSNIPYQARSTGGIFGTPVQPSGPTQGSSQGPRVDSPGLQAMFQIEDAPPGYTIDDIIRDVVEAGGTIEDAKAVVAKVMPEEGSDYSEREWQDSWAKSYNDRMYDGGDAPAINTPTSSGDGSYFQDIPQDVEQRYPVAGGSGSDSLLGASPDYFRQQAEAGNDITPSLPFDSPQVMRQAENLSPVDIPGSAPTNSKPTGSAQTDYYNTIYSSAKKQGANDTQARLAATQASLETGYGKSVKGNSHFGIKTGSSYKGPKVDFGTHEIVNGRAYEDLDDSVKGYMSFMEDRFPSAWNATTLEEASKGLKAGKSGGYATDPNYASKLSYIDRNFGGNVNAQTQAQTTTPTSRPGLFDAPQVDYSNLPQSIQEAHQQINDARTRMRDYDPRGDQVVATPGINGPQYHEDGVNGTTQKTTPQSYEQTLDQNLMLPGNLQPHQMPGTFYDPSMYNVAPIQPVATESFTLPTEDDANVNYEMVDGARTDPMTSNQAQEMRPHAGSV